jgi:hypothetical protein
MGWQPTTKVAVAQLGFWLFVEDKLSNSNETRNGVCQAFTMNNYAR